MKSLFFKLKYNRIKNQVYNIWSFYRKPRWQKVMIKYLLSGAISTAIHLTILSLAYSYLNLQIITATSLAYLIAFGVSFCLQKFWTFRNKSKRYLKQIYFYLLVGAFNLFFNAALMQFLVVNLDFHYLLSQIIVSGLVALNSFLLYKYLVFKNNS
jgi:putative flippase GtrA